MTKPTPSGGPPTPTPTTADRPAEADTRSMADQPSNPEPPSFASPPPESDEASLPNPFGRYAIRQRLGRGGMGTVYLAHDTHLDRLVALKVPRLGVGNRDLLRQRFEREARAAALLHHPHICPVYDVGAVGEVPYLTMAYIEGRPLSEWASNAGRPVAEIVGLVRTVALALEEAHRLGVVHRDLKPTNILIDRRGEPVIMDFGLARRLDLDAERLTQHGVLLGTPAYMPPEQVMGDIDATGPAGDVYSLGVILFELLTGQLPFNGSPTAILALIASQEPPPPRQFRPDLDPRLETVCLRALAKEVAARFPSMTEFAHALTPFLYPASTLTPVPAPPAPQPPVPPAPSSAVPVPTAGGPLDAALAPKILHYLRTYGWARGVQKIRIKAQKTREPERSAWQGFLDWMAGDRTEDARAAAAFQALPEGAALRGWVLAGRASMLLRDRDYDGAHRQLDKAKAQGDAEDRILQATIAHVRGAAHLHQGKFDSAVQELDRALTLLGREHFAVGRVLDTLGVVYAAKGHFHVAREFHEQSIRYKTRAGDEAGLAISHGQLGRLYLDWGMPDEAERHFQEDLRIAQKTFSRWSEVQMYNHLGQVALFRGEREAAAGRRAAAGRFFAEAAGWLDESIRRAEEGKWTVAEGFARKDRATLALRQGDLAEAERQLRQAFALFQAAQFPEGTAKAQRVEGMILCARGKHDEALRKLRAALGYFDGASEHVMAVRTQWEVARTLRASGAPAPLVTRAFREALARAEGCRHAALVREIEEELREVDPEAYLRHAYRRVRGRDIEEDAPSLLASASEVVTVLFLDLPDFADFAKGHDPQAVLLTFNQLMADCAAVLERNHVGVMSYLGGGLMAVARDARHAERAVDAALELMTALAEFNRPRRVLGLPVFHARIAIHTGPALLGNVGTYRRMDFTAIGPAVNLAGRLLDEARPGLPLVSRAVHGLIGDQFLYQTEKPRVVTPTGLDVCEVWDVLRRRP